jgi:peptidoglycan/LPS O-acetylase OafA/YrhL
VSPTETPPRTPQDDGGATPLRSPYRNPHLWIGLIAGAVLITLLITRAREPQQWWSATNLIVGLTLSLWGAIDLLFPQYSLFSKPYSLVTYTVGVILIIGALTGVY